MDKVFNFVYQPVSTFFPVDEDEKTKGYCFIEYETPEQTSAAAKILDGYQLDKKHTFSAYILSAMRNLKAPEAEWTPPTAKDYVDAVSFLMRRLHANSKYHLFRGISGGGFKTPNVWISLLFKLRVARVLL